MSEHTHLVCKRLYGNLAVIRFVGLAKVSTDVVDALGRELDRVMDEDRAANVVMNFDGIASICSAMLGNLVRLREKMDSENRELKLCNLSELVVRTLKMLHLDELFETHETEDAAVASFGADSG